MSYAQQASAENYAVQQKIRSPQVASMMRFDGVGGISKLSGRLDLNIELMRIQDKDFDLPVALSYNSAGFMPSAPESYVGLNWSLNAGGAIIREVKGIPDDVMSVDGVYTDYGFIYFVENENTFSQEPPIESMEDWGRRGYIHVKGTPFSTGYKAVEASSDIYHFNFGTHSGKFMINFDGSVSVVSNNGGKYKVDLSDYYRSSFNSLPNAATIRIITDDGYTYSFGGTYDSVEYSYSWKNIWENSIGNHTNTGSGNGLDLVAPSGPSISSYHLSKIEAPNGRELNLEYVALSQSSHRNLIHNLAGSIGFRNIMYDNVMDPSVRMNFVSSWHPTYTEFVTVRIMNVDENNNAPLHNITKLALIKRIYTDSQEISLDYTATTYGPYDATLYDAAKGHHEFELKAGAELQEVTLKSYNEGNGSSVVVNKAILGYDRWEGVTGSRRILTSFDLSSTGTYEFKYNVGENDLPSPLTTNIDFWNYWRGNTPHIANQDRLSIPEHYTNGLEVVYGNPATHSIEQNTSRSPVADGVGVDLGMLNEVTFPTGGKMNVEYESHEYYKYINRDGAYYTPELSVNYIKRKAGGVRVKSISQDGLVTCYLYRESIDEQYAPGNMYKNSGILLYQPKLITTIPTSVYGHQPEQSNATGFDTQSYEEDHVRYSAVIEVMDDPEQPSNGYKIERFTDWTDIPNGMVNLSYYSGEIPVQYGASQLNTLFHPTDRSYMRGKPKSTEVYDSDNRLIRKEDFVYAEPDAMNIQTTHYYIGFYRPFFYLTNPSFESENAFQKVPVELGWRPLESKTVTEYFYDLQGNPSGEIERREEYNYAGTVNPFLYLQEKTTTDSEGAELKEVYTYSYETDSPIKNLNVLGAIVQHNSKKNGITLYSKKNNYEIVNQNSSQMPVLRSQELTRDGVTETRARFLQFDDYGNRVHIEIDGNNVFHLWSYKGKYLIAEVRGCDSYNTFKAAVEDVFGRSIGQVPHLDDVSQAQLYALRNDSQLEGTSVTTAYYKPLIGVTSVTDPSGRTMSYAYDEQTGKLSEIRDDNGNLMQEFDYYITNNSSDQNYVRTTTYTASGGSSSFLDVDYYDGLGYLSQRIGVGASPGGGSIVTPIYYDPLKRESRKYLPYATTSSTITYQPSAISDQTSFYNDKYSRNNNFSYTENIYEISPLNRVNEAWNVGAVYRTNNKKSTLTYETNGTNEVALFKVDGSGMLARLGNYDENMLYKNSVRNEDGALVSTFTDLFGRVVLERKVDGSDNYDTYYVYDEHGNLCYVLPPELSDKPNPTTADIDAYAYVYVHDHRGRCIEKRLPGTDPIYMVYDKGDRVVMAQDGNMRVDNRWMHTVYDNLDRVVSQSLVSGNADLSTIRSHFEGSGTSLPTSLSTETILVENHYDQY